MCRASCACYIGAMCSIGCAHKPCRPFSSQEPPGDSVLQRQGYYSPTARTSSPCNAPRRPSSRRCTKSTRPRCASSKATARTKRSPCARCARPRSTSAGSTRWCATRRRTCPSAGSARSRWAGWQRLFEINFFSVVRLLTATLPLLRKSASARVIMVTSSAATVGIPGGGPYAAAKAALNSLNRTLAAEDPSITSVAFHPGAVRTEMVRELERMSGKGHVPDDFIKLAVEYQMHPDVPGRALANLVLRAPKELSGEYLHWDDPKVAAV